MTPAERQADLIARYAIIPDVHERLAALTSRKSPLPLLSAEERTEANLVPGCISRVWLVGFIEERHCRFRMDCDSAMVKGLARVLCEIYDNALPAEIVATEPDVFEALGIDRQLTPTRLNGLANIRARIRAFAAAL
jgi:cysteine desulfuration protein SufE